MRGLARYLVALTRRYCIGHQLQRVVVGCVSDVGFALVSVGIESVEATRSLCHLSAIFASNCGCGGFHFDRVHLREKCDFGAGLGIGRLNRAH